MSGGGRPSARRVGLHVLLLFLCGFLVGLVQPGASASQDPPAEEPPPEPSLEPLPRVGPRLDSARKEDDGEADSLPTIPAPDPRRQRAIREVLRLECASDLGYRDVVLFSDGVARIKERLASEGEETLLLHDFSPDDYQAYLNRLELAPAPDAGDLTVHAPEGAWVDRCRLVVKLPDTPRQEDQFGPFDSLSLALSHRLAIAREIRQAVRDASQLSSLPRNYQARRGDVLERRDGALFEVLRETGDGGGLEMKGVGQPITLYIPKGAVRQEFVRLVSRRP